MSNLEGWNVTCSKSKKKYDSDDIIRVKPDCKLKVRLIGQPVRIVRVFTKDRKCLVLDNTDTGRQLKDKYPDKISNVSIRYACWCIYRDSGEVKILDMPTSVARTFGNRTEIVDRKISGIDEGCDWVIVSNGKKGKDVRYDAFYLEETPLTEEEKEMVKSKMEDKDSFDLTKVFESNSFEEAEERLLNM